MKVVALNNRFSMQVNSPISEEGATWDFHSWGGESVPGFQASEDRPTLLLGAHAAGDVKLKPVLTSCSESPRALRNYLNGLCLCPVNGTTKPG